MQVLISMHSWLLVPSDSLFAVKFSYFQGLLLIWMITTGTLLPVSSNSTWENSPSHSFRQKQTPNLKKLQVSACLSLTWVIFAVECYFIIKCSFIHSFFTVCMALLEMGSSEMCTAILRLLVDELPACNRLLLGWLLEHMSHVAEKVGPAFELPIGFLLQILPKKNMVTIICACCDKFFAYLCLLKHIILRLKQKLLKICLS